MPERESSVEMTPDIGRLIDGFLAYYNAGKEHDWQRTLEELTQLAKSSDARRKVILDSVGVEMEVRQGNRPREWEQKDLKALRVLKESLQMP